MTMISSIKWQNPRLHWWCDQYYIKVTWGKISTTNTCDIGEFSQNQFFVIENEAVWVAKFIRQEHYFSVTFGIANFRSFFSKAYVDQLWNTSLPVKVLFTTNSTSRSTTLPRPPPKLPQIYTIPKTRNEKIAHAHWYDFLRVHRSLISQGRLLTPPPCHVTENEIYLR